MKHIFTVDVEEWYDGICDGGTQIHLETRLRDQMEILLHLLRIHGTEATFFWLGKRAKEYPGLVKQCAEEGHEIGCHGLIHSQIDMLAPDEFRSELKVATSILSDITGKSIESYRAPYFSINRKNFHVFEILAGLGYKYDSSIFPIQHWRYGMPDFPCEIQTIQTASGSIVEFPLPVIRFGGINVPATGGAYFRIYPYTFTSRNIRSIERRKHPAVFYLHPWELDIDQPRIRSPWKISLPHYALLNSTIPKLHIRL
jgi:polysaccharide deacetylase family protein (PEP-CTERM system associated)